MMPQRDSGELELRDYLSVLRRRKWTILLAVLVVVGSALAVSFLQTPVYSAEAELLLQSRTSEDIVDPRDNSVQSQSRVETEIEVMRSRSISDAVREQLGREPDVSINAEGSTDVLEVSAEDTEPERAADEANTYVEVYVETRRQQLIRDYFEVAEEIQSRVEETQDAINLANVPLFAANAAVSRAEFLLLSTAGPPVALERAQRDLDRVRQDLERVQTNIANQTQPLQTELATYQAELGRLQLATQLTETGGAQVVSEAITPTNPIRPTPRRNAIFAAFVGLMLGVALAFLFEYLDDSIGSKDDLERATGGLTVLGLIPSVPGWRDRKAPRVVSITEPSSPASEAYRSLRTSVQFLGLDKAIDIVQLTSPSASEGKSTTLANLGVALARAGQRVVVVDCDLRRPRIHEFYGVDNTVGFTSVLLGETPLSAALQGVLNEPRLAVLASGPIPPNPSELLSTRRAAEVLDALKGECDVILIDSPPVLPVTDAIILSGLADATLLVVSANTSTKKAARRAMEQLLQVDAPLVGAVLNGIDAEDTYAYGYGYGHGYGASSAKGAKGKADENGRTNGVAANGSATSNSREGAARLPEPPPLEEEPSGRD